MSEAFNQSSRESTYIPSERSQRGYKSISGNISMSIYKSSINQFKEFLSIFQKRLESVYEKENYRIYLNDKFHERIYKKLIEQKEELHQALEDSKDYKQSTNRALIEEVMNLQKLKEEYDMKNSDYEQKIQSKKKEVLEKKKALKQLETEIKSYWIYNYDITTAVSSVQSSSRINKEKSIKSSRNETEENLDFRFHQDKENYPASLSKRSNTIDIHSSEIRKKNSIHLPLIPSYHRYDSNLKCTSNYSNYHQLQRYQNTTTILSKDLSLINSSSTKEKLFQKIEFSNKTQAIEKLEYQKEKVNLLKFFKIYLKKISQEQSNFTQRMRLEKVVTQIEERILIKEEKLKQIQQLLLK